MHVAPPWACGLKQGAASGMAAAGSGSVAGIEISRSASCGRDEAVSLSLSRGLKQSVGEKAHVFGHAARSRARGLKLENVDLRAGVAATRSRERMD